MTCTLFPDKAPIGVANFIGLATGTKDWKNPVSGVTKHGVPLYDGTIFHRVIPGFMIQGGDPEGDGTGDPGYQIQERSFFRPVVRQARPPRLRQLRPRHERLAVLHHRGSHAAPQRRNYTIFGQCDEATVALVKQIAHMATDPMNDRPFRPVKIIHITIVHGAAAAAAAKPATPAPKPAANPTTCEQPARMSTAALATRPATND